MPNNFSGEPESRRMQVLHEKKKREKVREITNRTQCAAKQVGPGSPTRDRGREGDRDRERDRERGRGL